MNKITKLEAQIMEPMLRLYAEAVLSQPKYMTLADAKLRHQLQIQPQETICVEHFEFVWIEGRG